jgi:hypothetical protein
VLDVKRISRLAKAIPLLQIKKMILIGALSLKAPKTPTPSRRRTRMMDDKDRDEAKKLCKRLDWMKINGKNDLVQWENVLSYEIARIRAEEWERILSKGALAYIRELENALCTMLPDGTSIDTVLMHPEKWRATYTDDKEVHRG